jgi:class 3 adenylate cyclase/tetratricopeptide (TPR) repeat protein
MACGTELARTPSEEAEERKVVTILFCDLVGFTARSDRADPEDIRGTLRPYHARLTQEIERFGGTVEKFIGDAVMAVYGAPVAHEDDPERAVRSALNILDAIEELNERTAGLQLVVRIGVNTGEALVSLSGGDGREGMVTGDVVNTAARLEAIAPPGGAVVGERTYQTTRHLFEYEHLDPVMVKGKAEPVRIWRARSARSRVPLGAAPPSTPFVGRGDELELLKRICGRTFRESSVQLVTLVGEPGVGKTRLMKEFIDVIGQGADPVLWLQGRCLAYGEGITFWALGEVVKAQAGILESDSPDEASAKLDAAVGVVVDEPSVREWMRDRLAPLVGVFPPVTGGGAERAESFTAWRSFLEALASTRPTILAFEDLHWADSAMLDFLDHLVDWAMNVPMLLVGTARPELFERRPDWGGGKRNSTTISLPPLADEDVTTLLSSLLSAERSSEVRQMVLDRAEGNPLYAEEFARMLTDRDPGKEGAEAWAPEGDLPFPSSIQAIIAARLDTLSPERKSLLQDAAVVGKVFWSGSLSYMSGTDDQAVREGLHELTRKELVRPARSSSVREQEEFSFWHSLIRDVAYGQIPRVSRARRHRAAAEWSERLAGDRVADHAELIAYHYRQALELARAAGVVEEAAELETRTSRFLVMAGDRAAPLDVARSAQHYQQALKLIAPDDPSRVGVLVKAAEMAVHAGGFSEAEMAYLEAIEEFKKKGDELAAGDVMVKLSILYWFRGEAAQCRAVLNQAVELLELEPPSPELARAYTEQGVDKLALGLFHEAVAWSDKALALAEKFQMEEDKPRPLAFRGLARCQLGDFEGIDDIRQAIELSFHLGLSRETARTHAILAEMVWVTEGPAGGLEDCRIGIELAEARGNIDLAAAIRVSSLDPLFDLGRWDEVLRVADEVIWWSQATGQRYHEVWAESHKARVLLLRGRFSEAAALAERFMPAARDILDPQVLAPALVVAAVIEQARPDHGSAVRLIEELVELTRDRPPWFRTHHLPDIVRVCAAGGALGMAEELVGTTQAHATRHVLGLLTAQATIAEARANMVEASGLFAEAARGWQAYGAAPERALALLGEGRCLLRAGHGAASARLREAKEVLSTLDALPLVAEADAWLERAAVNSS